MSDRPVRPARAAPAAAGAMAAGAVALLLAALLPGVARAAACRPEVAELRAADGRALARFSVEIADDTAERAQGLMNRDSLRASAGMLFVYPVAQRVGFWMKNTRIPLDMVFLDPAGRVTRVHENAVPMDETPIDGGAGVLAVLEINGGMAARMGIGPGAQMRHPAFGAAAAWPCE